MWTEHLRCIGDPQRGRATNDQGHVRNHNAVVVNSNRSIRLLLVFPVDGVTRRGSGSGSNSANTKARVIMLRLLQVGMSVSAPNHRLKHCETTDRMEVADLHGAIRGHPSVPLHPWFMGITVPSWLGHRDCPS